MPILLLLTLCLASCSPRQNDQRDVNRLPDYSDMGAAEDAGRTPAFNPAQPKTGGVK
jgi:hypothetical protein